MAYEQLTRRLEKLTQTNPTEVKPIIITTVYEGESIGPDYLTTDEIVEAVRVIRGDPEGTKYPLIIFSEQNTKIIQPSRTDERIQPDGFIEELFSDDEDFEDYSLGIVEEIKHPRDALTRKTIGYRIICR